MKSLKVVFFGTPEFAAASLDAIHHSHHKVVAVVTVADKASGRGQKIQESAVKKYAVENHLPVFRIYLFSLLYVLNCYYLFKKLMLINRVQT